MLMKPPRYSALADLTLSSGICANAAAIVFPVFWNPMSACSINFLKRLRAG
jgi:hypothetical protein